MTDKPDILFMSEHEDELFARLSEHYTVHVVPMIGEAERAAAIEAAAPKARALLAISILGPTTEQVRTMTSLEHLAYLGAGYQSMDMEAFKALGVTGSFVPAANAGAVAEYAMTLTLALIRELPAADKFVRTGRWGPEFGPPLASGLEGKRVGIIGLGEAGGRFAKLADAFGAVVAYHKPTPNPDAPYQYFPTLVELAGNSDVLIVASPGGPATQDMINAEILAALGPDGYLVNIARGSIVDTDALISALQSGTIAGAGLDVVAGEPGVPDALSALDNVILSPHRAGVTREAVRVQWDIAMENLAAHFAGKPLITPIPGMES